MNFFFSISNDFLKCNLTIPRFQNRGKIDYEHNLSSVAIYKKRWLIRKEKVETNQYFFSIIKDYGDDNKIYFLSKEDLDNVRIENLKIENHFLKTNPAFRSNLRIENSSGGFSSYQSEYPSGMVQNRGNILSQISSLLNREATKNLIIFKNIYKEPISTNFKVYIIDIEKEKVVLEKNFYTNKLNFLEIDKELLNKNNFLFSDNYLGIPIYLSEKDKNLSLEHTHPLQTYIMTQNKHEIIKNLKDNAKKIITRQI